MAGKLLFPKYLNKGSKGPAVALLQAMLLAGGYNDSIVIDGDYGDETADGVLELQADLGIEQDGNFGPDTRRYYLEQMKIDVNSLEADLFQGKTIGIGP